MFTTISKQDFKQINKIETGSERENPMFTVIEKLIQEKKISKEYPYKKLDCGAYLFHLLSKPEHQLFQDQNYKFKERHLRVDKYYRLENDNNGFHGASDAHYTETYSKDDTSEKIVVYLYFSSKDTYVKIKHPNRECRFVDENKYIGMIKENGSLALNYYHALIKEKDKRYQDSLTDLNRLEGLLEDFGDKFETKEDIEAYLNILNQCIKCVDKINCYNKLQKDRRGFMFEKTRKNLIKKLREIPENEINQKSEVEQVEECLNEGVGSELESVVENQEKKILTDSSKYNKSTRSAISSRR